MYFIDCTDVCTKICDLFCWCVTAALNKLPFTEDDLSEFSAFVKEVAEEASCIVELPFGFNGLTLGCKSCGSSYSIENEWFRHYIGCDPIDSDPDDDYYDDSEFFTDWVDEVVYNAAPLESVEAWTKFFQTLHQKLECKQISDRFSNIITWQNTPDSVSFFDLIGWRPMNWKNKTRLRLAAFFEQCIYCFLDHMENDRSIPDDALSEFSALVEEAAVEASCIVVLPFELNGITLGYKNKNRKRFYVSYVFDFHSRELNEILCPYPNRDRAYVMDAHSFDEKIAFFSKPLREDDLGVIMYWAEEVVDECAATEEDIKAWSEFFDTLYHKLESHPNPVNEAFLDACWRNKSGWTRFCTKKFYLDEDQFELDED